MSLLQFQASLAELIRLPEKNRGDKSEDFLNRFQLSKDERQRLERLAKDKRVVKYGRSMAGVRWETIEEQLRLCKRFISREDLQHIWSGIFEPQATRIRFHQLTARFLDCLIEDPAAQGILSGDAPPFIGDILKFERTQLAFYRQDISIEKEPAPDGSLLRHAAFRILKLDHDIPGLILRISEKSDDLPLEEGPEPRKIIILLLPDETEPGCRYFEIDESVYEFLEALRKDPMAVIEPLKSYADLVKIGLCKPLS